MLHNHWKEKKMNAANSTLCFCPEVTCDILFIFHCQSLFYGHPNLKSQEGKSIMCLEGKRNIFDGQGLITTFYVYKTVIPLGFAGKIFTSLYIR